MDGKRASTRFTNRGWLGEDGVQISCAPWRSDVDTFEQDYQVYGFPLHLWSNENLAKIGDEVGEAVAIDRATLEFAHIDAARVKIKTRKGKYWLNPIKVTKGVKKYTLAFYPMVLEYDVKLGVDRARWVDPFQ